jgi:hypothetical protein
MKSTAPLTPLTPRERVESFIDRTRCNAGAFVGQSLLGDGYIQIRFQRASYFTLPDSKAAIYKDGCGYTRPRAGQGTEGKVTNV